MTDITAAAPDYRKELRRAEAKGSVKYMWGFVNGLVIGALIVAVLALTVIYSKPTSEIPIIIDQGPLPGEAYGDSGQ